MISCRYCGYCNEDNVLNCVQCGAPKNHNFDFIEPAAAVFSITSIDEVTTVVWPVVGIDQSSWNGTMNASITRLLAQFGHIRGGYGNSNYDPIYPVYRELYDEFKIERGLYWYCWIGEDWRAHASSIANLWKQSPGKLEITIDAEYTKYDMEITEAWLHNLVQELQLKTGIAPMIYTAGYWWNTHVARNQWAGFLPLWIAHWNSTITAPYVPLEWSENVGLNRWRYWQWSADDNNLATQYGFSGGDADIDLNRFNGTVETFNIQYGTSILPIGIVEDLVIPPDTDIEYLYRAKVTANALNVRQGPGIENTDLGELYLNSVVPIKDEFGDWIRIDGWIHKYYTKKL